jgi:galactitol-specific phosphotransferase system IIB component
MAVDKMKNIGLGQNATAQNVADAMKDTLFTTLWAVGGSSTVGSASNALKSVSTDPIPQFQSQVLPEDLWARAKDAGVSTEKINALKNEVSSLSDVGEITKIEAAFKESLESVGFTPQEIERLTGPVVTEAVTNEVISTLRDSGVPAGKIADISKQVAAELTSGNDAVTTAHNLLDIFDANNVDPKKANTMAADYTGLMTVDQVNQIAANNPNLTSEQLSAALATATKDLVTLQEFKNALSGLTFPAGMTKADVVSAVSEEMAKHPGLSLRDLMDVMPTILSGLATSEGVNTAITDALSEYATTKDVEAIVSKAFNDFKVPAGMTQEDMIAALKNYMKENTPE